jgi:tetratricopeptide (TPR) repeat protein
MTLRQIKARAAGQLASVNPAAERVNIDSNERDSQMIINRQLAPFALTCIFLLFGCNSKEPRDSTAGAVPAASISQVRAALDRKDFGEAVTLADQLTEANPHSADAWLAAADAKASAGNRIDALGAIEKALTNGVHDTAQLDSDPYLDSLRASNEYQMLLRRYGLQNPLARAGDTSIEENSAGTVVRAGDVSVTLPNTK